MKLILNNFLTLKSKRKPLIVRKRMVYDKLGPQGTAPSVAAIAAHLCSFSCDCGSEFSGSFF